MREPLGYSYLQRVWLLRGNLPRLFARVLFSACLLGVIIAVTGAAGENSPPKIKEKRPPAEDPILWYQKALRAEAAGNIDLAIAYYRAVVKGSRDTPNVRQFSRRAQRSRRRLKKLDTLDADLARLRHETIRKVDILARRYNRDKNFEHAIEAYAILCNLDPKNEKAAHGYYRNLIALDMARKLPTGSHRSLFNGYDFTGWQVRSGTWRVIDNNLVGLDGMIRLLDNPESYKLTMVYRALAEVKKNPATLWIHKAPGRLSGSEIILTGEEAGLAQGIAPAKKYVKKVMEDDLSRYYLRKKTRYLAGEWNQLEVEVKGHRYTVKLNKKVVFKTSPEARVLGYRGEFARQFPGNLHIYGGAGIVIKSIKMKGRKD